MKTIELKNLERLSLDWDKLTVKIAVFISGSGNMFGGSGKLLVCTLHGENSIETTGKIDVLGEISYSYNIARGANGISSSSATYIENNIELNRLELTGLCNADSALVYAMDLKKDWYVE